jgi:DNA repair exonuclease SbcCD ATPase subunit
MDGRPQGVQGLTEPLQNLGAEEAVGILRERMGGDGTVALLGLLRYSQEEALRALGDRFEKLEQRLEQRFAALEGCIDRLEARWEERFAQVDARFAQVDARLAQVDARFAQVDARLAQVDARLDQINVRFDQVNARIDGTLRYALTFTLSLLGLMAAAATGPLALWR